MKEKNIYKKCENCYYYNKDRGYHYCNKKKRVPSYHEIHNLVGGCDSFEDIIERVL